jgi:hypothetical protein
VKNIASRAALTALALLAAFAIPARAQVGAPTPAPAGPSARPTPTPIYVPLTPPPSVPPAPVTMPQRALAANGECANDRFHAVRTIPMPTQFDVMVCGVVTAVSGPGSFQLSIDGSKPLTVHGPNLPSVHPGDEAAVKGVYHRDKTGAEVIDVGRAGAPGSVTVLPATPQ